MGIISRRGFFGSSREEFLRGARVACSEWFKQESATLSRRGVPQERFGVARRVGAEREIRLPGCFHPDCLCSLESAGAAREDDRRLRLRDASRCALEDAALKAAVGGCARV
jgi:hypothetical protein